jgi:xanthine dehydrogenase accessory factor
MRDLLDEIEQWSARGDRIALATVVDTPRSAPRPPGAKMAINDRGEVAGRDHGRSRRGKERPLGNRLISTGGRIHGQVELERG